MRKISPMDLSSYQVLFSAVITSRRLTPVSYNPFMNAPISYFASEPPLMFFVGTKVSIFRPAGGRTILSSKTNIVFECLITINTLIISPFGQYSSFLHTFILQVPAKKSKSSDSRIHYLVPIEASKAGHQSCLCFH